MFYIGYGDIVRWKGFLSAGMTFEKDRYDPVGQRVREQYIVGVNVVVGARDAQDSGAEAMGSFRTGEAYNEGKHRKA